MHKPMIIVIEGTDGAGKETQKNNLIKKLTNEYRISQGHISLEPVIKSVSFPKYDHFSAEPIKKYLAGDFGSVDDCRINSYGASILYTLNRYLTYIEEDGWKNDLDNCDIFIIDRYISSNFIHQGAKIGNTSDLLDYVKIMEDLEYNRLELPKPDVTFFLNMPSEASEILRQNRPNKITGGKKQDIHEANKAYMCNAYNTAYVVAHTLKWNIINCAKESIVHSIEDIYTPDEITDRIIAEVIDKFNSDNSDKELHKLAD